MLREQELRDEIEEFRREKNRIKEIVGEIGGSQASRQHKAVNILLIAIIVVILVVGIALDKLDIVTTLEVAILVGIFKIIWMIYEFQRVNHFQFWILNSLEFRINEIHKKVKTIEKNLDNKNLKQKIDSDSLGE
ncbi:MAG: hypothetical protein ACRCZ9_11500 [Fusobacteriaceae bacterium]